MGISFRAILGHRFDNVTIWDSLQSLQPIETNHLMDALLTLFPPNEIDYSQTVIASGHEPWQWDIYIDRQIDIENDRGTPRLKGPAGLYSYIGRHSCEWGNYWFNWYAFITDTMLQVATRNIFRQLAKQLHSPCAVYLPDSTYPVSIALDYVDEGWSIETIVDWLQATHGSPAKAIADIYRELPDNMYTLNGYYLDYF